MYRDIIYIHVYSSRQTASIYLYICTYACMHVCMYVCMYVRIYIHTYIHTYIWSRRSVCVQEGGLASGASEVRNGGALIRALIEP